MYFTPNESMITSLTHPMYHSITLISRLEGMSGSHNKEIEKYNLQSSVLITVYDTKNIQHSNLKPIFELGLMNSRITHFHP